MSANDINNGPGFFLFTMGGSRPADYCLGYGEGSVYIDFDNCGDQLICLKRISFDGYGCCNMTKEAIPMDEADSRAFKEIIREQIPDQSKLMEIIKRTLSNNIDQIWEDALSEYGLI